MALLGSGRLVGVGITTEMNGDSYCLAKNKYSAVSMALYESEQ